MAAPAGTRMTGRGRIYTRRGRNYWSVTTIIKNGVPAPALQQWGMTEVARFAVANHRQISGMLGSVRLVKADDGTHLVSDPDAVEGAIAWLRQAPYRESERKADIGKAIHSLVESRILGTPVPEIADELRPRMARFAEWEATFAPEYLAAETTVFSDRESYAGTADIFARIAGRTLIIDTKTGKDVYPDAALQLAAYAHADYVGLADGTDVPLPAFDGGAVLHLTDAEARFVPVLIDDTVFRAFLYAREVFRWAEETSKGVLSMPLAGPAGVPFLWPDRSEEPAEVADVPAA